MRKSQGSLFGVGLLLAFGVWAAGCSKESAPPAPAASGAPEADRAEVPPVAPQPPPAAAPAPVPPPAGKAAGFSEESPKAAAVAEQAYGAATPGGAPEGNAVAPSNPPAKQEIPQPPSGPLPEPQLVDKPEGQRWCMDLFVAIPGLECLWTTTTDLVVWDAEGKEIARVSEVVYVMPPDTKTTINSVSAVTLTPDKLGYEIVAHGSVVPQNGGGGAIDSFGANCKLEQGVLKCRSMAYPLGSAKPAPVLDPNAAGSYLPARLLDAQTNSENDPKTSSAIAAIDGNMDTAWIEGANEYDGDADGIGDWIELRFPKPLKVNYLEVRNGYQKVKNDKFGDRWPRNQRVRLVHVRAGNELTVSFELKDTKSPQKIPLGGIETDRVRLTIQSVYSAEFDDTAIAELRAHVALQQAEMDAMPDMVRAAPGTAVLEDEARQAEENFKQQVADNAGKPPSKGIEATGDATHPAPERMWADTVKECYAMDFLPQRPGRECLFVAPPKGLCVADENRTILECTQKTGRKVKRTMVDIPDSLVRVFFDPARDRYVAIMKLSVFWDEPAGALMGEVYAECFEEKGKVKCKWNKSMDHDLLGI